jgi:CubicO group peptidase (beta-lactamase class C family)
MRSKLLSQPGKAWHYSNVSYSILAAIIERASGMGYEPFLARYLFGPAGMRHTGYVLPHWRGGQVAVEYNRHGRPMGRPFDHPWAGSGPYWNLRGNGGMISTAPDMLRWDRALLHHTILPRDTERELFTPRVRIDAAGDRYAYGWEILASPLGPIAAHNGSNGWSFSVIARLLHQKALVFWVSNHAFHAGRWNLERDQLSLTFGLLQAAVPAGWTHGPGSAAARGAHGRRIAYMSVWDRSSPYFGPRSRLVRRWMIPNAYLGQKVARPGAPSWQAILAVKPTFAYQSSPSTYL